MRTLVAIVVFGALAACGGNEKSAPARPPAIENRIEGEPSEAPPESAASETGVPECDEFLALFDRILEKCDKEFAASRDALAEAAQAQRAAFAQWKTLDDETRKTVYDSAVPGCKAGSDAIRQAAASVSCPLD